MPLHIYSYIQYSIFYISNAVRICSKYHFLLFFWEKAHTEKETRMVEFLKSKPKFLRIFARNFLPYPTSLESTKKIQQVQILVVRHPRTGQVILIFQFLALKKH